MPRDQECWRDQVLTPPMNPVTLLASLPESNEIVSCAGQTLECPSLACFDFHFDGFEELVFETEKILGNRRGYLLGLVVAKPKHLVATKSKQQTL